MNPFRLSPADRKLLAALIASALVGSFALFRFFPATRSGGPAEQPSTFFTAGYGLKAAYTTLGRLGFSVERLRTSPRKDRLAGVRTLFVLGPVVEVDKGTRSELLDWVARGHVLVVSPGEGDGLEHWFDSSSVPDKAKPGVAELEPDSPVLEGVRSLSMPKSLTKVLGGPAIGPLEQAETSLFWKDARGTLGIWVSHGDGVIVALADAYPLTNQGLLEDDDARLLANLGRLRATPADSGRLVFDEYHLGFDEHDTSPVALAKLVVEGTYRTAALQALGACALAVLFAVVRFGNAVTPVQKRRRKHGEFADAAGRLLHDAGANDLVEARLVEHFRLRARKLVDLSPAADDGVLGVEIVRRTGVDVGPLLVRPPGATNPSRKDVLESARLLYRTLEALERGSR